MRFVTSEPKSEIETATGGESGDIEHMKRFSTSPKLKVRPWDRGRKGTDGLGFRVLPLHPSHFGISAKTAHGRQGLRTLRPSGCSVGMS